jgi:tRNA-dihydrouridine synthase B
MDAQTAVERLQKSGVDGVIVARGAIGNPWIFQEIRSIMTQNALPVPPSLAEQGQLMLEHFELICAEKPLRKAVPYFRKFSAGYCRRHPERKKTLLAIMGSKTKEDTIEIIRRSYGLD